MDITNFREFYDGVEDENPLPKRARIMDQLNDLQLGHQYMYTLMHNLSRYDTESKFPRSRDQVLIHRKMCAVAARVIYRYATFERYKMDIMREHGFDDVRNKLAAMMPRREGKTVGSAQWYAAMLVSVPWSNICLVASNQRAAGQTGLSGHVKYFLCTVFGKRENTKDFKFNNGSVIELKQVGLDVPKFKCYPGGAKNK